MLPNIDNVKLTYTQSKGETHHLGKSPVFVSIQVNDVEFGKVVYKPRNAKIDQEVIKTLESINALPENQKSGNAPLPIYRICPLENEGSFWEFIEGKSFVPKAFAPISSPNEGIPLFNSPTSVSTDCIEEYLVSEKLNNPQTLDGLVRMDAILQAMHVTDLHIENIILQKREGCYTIYVVDFENINPDCKVDTFLRSQLCRLKDEIPFELTREENILIDQFRESCHRFPFRVVPASTKRLNHIVYRSRLGNRNCYISSYACPKL